MIPMTAVKLVRYAGRKIQPGEPFDAKTAKDAKILVAIGRAQYSTAAIFDAPVQKPMVAAVPPVAAPVPTDAADGMDALRAEYQARVGKRPWMGWDADTLRAKMAAHEPTADGVAE